MLSSYVLRVVAQELPSGRLVGEVESVTSGATSTFSSVAELIAFCQRDAEHEASPVDPDAEPGRPFHRGSQL